VSVFENPNVWVVNTATQQVTNPLTLASDINGWAMSPDGSELYTCINNGTVSVIDTGTNQVAGSITIGVSKGHVPWTVAFTPDGNTAYVGGKPNRHPNGQNRGYIAVVDTSTQKVTGSLLITTGKPSSATLAMAPTGKDVFYSQEETIPIISTSTTKVVRTLWQSFVHGGALITPNGKFLYMCAARGSSSYNEVAMVDIGTGKVAGKQVSLNLPVGLAIAPNGNFAYVVFEMSPGNWGLAVVDISTS
jgi:YVTN family beta-propeller protein